MPLIVIESSVDDKLIFVPGSNFFILLLSNNVFEFVASVVLLNVACLLFISVLIVCIFVVISSLLYASTAVIVKLLSSSVSDKLDPTIFFNLDVVVFNKLLLPVISVPLLILFCLLSNFPLIVVKKLGSLSSAVDTFCHEFNVSGGNPTTLLNIVFTVLLS
jgi:hypothetical protein